MGGFLLEDQVRLLEQVKGSFPSRVIIAVNKTDVASPDEVRRARELLVESALEISGQTGSGIEDLREKISSYLIEPMPK